MDLTQKTPKPKRNKCHVWYQPQLNSPSVLSFYHILFNSEFIFLLQQRVAKLELQYCDLQKENAEVQKNLKDCHALLITAKIDPGRKNTKIYLSVSVSSVVSVRDLTEIHLSFLVLGERVGDTARQNESQRKEVMVCLFDFTLHYDMFTLGFYSLNI